MASIGKVLFGSGPKVTQTNPLAKIAPESDYEKAMREQLTGVSTGLMGNVAGLYNNSEQAFDNARQTYGAANNELNNVLQGRMPSAYQQNFEDGIRSGVQNTVGNIANNLARRGIGLNGTSFTNQLNSVNQSVANAAANNFQQGIGQQMQGVGQRMQGVGLMSGLGGQYANLAQGMMQPGMNLYGDWRNSRYSLQGDTVVKPAQKGLLQMWAENYASTMGGGM